MIVAVVRSRLKPNIDSDYQTVAQRMSELACTVPGYITHKGFQASDGERVTIVEFEDAEALEAWRTHPEHLDAKRRGFRDFYTHFRFQLCHVFREKSWAAKVGKSSDQ